MQADGGKYVEGVGAGSKINTVVQVVGADVGPGGTCKAGGG